MTSTSGTAFAVLENLGTVAFAISGASVAMRAGMDWLGVAVLAVVTSVGGGSLRDLLAGEPGARWIHAPGAVWVALATAAGVIVAARFLGDRRLEAWPVVIVADAAGLAAFTVTGTQLSTAAGIGAPVAVLLGVITGTGGGVIRDVLARQRPLVLTAEVYALASLAGAVLVTAAGAHGLQPEPARWGTVAVVLGLRLAAVRWNWSLPRFPPAGGPT